MTRMKLGQRIVFKDANATTSGAEPVYVEGSLNSNPIECDGATLYPVWCERDNGREPTTVYVHESNIVEPKLGG